MSTFTLSFEIGAHPGGEEPKNYVKKLLKKESCQAVQTIFLGQELSNEEQEDVHNFWTECGHRVREKIKDDLRLEFILRKTLPAYSGSIVTLYRGENIERYNEKRIGFCWTENIETARMFASGLNSYSSGGFLLKCEFDKEQIIAAPSRHSLYLNENEYTVAPSTIDFNKITILESFPTAF